VTNCCDWHNVSVAIAGLAVAAVVPAAIEPCVGFRKGAVPVHAAATPPELELLDELDPELELELVLELAAPLLEVELDAIPELEVEELPELVELEVEELPELVELDVEVLPELVELDVEVLPELVELDGAPELVELVTAPELVDAAVLPPPPPPPPPPQAASSNDSSMVPTQPCRCALKSTGLFSTLGRPLQASTLIRSSRCPTPARGGIQRLSNVITSGNPYRITRTTRFPRRSVRVKKAAPQASVGRMARDLTKDAQRTLNANPSPESHYGDAFYRASIARQLNPAGNSTIADNPRAALKQLR
jgi:hypothetical protein